MMLCLDQGCPILLLEGQHPEHFSLPFTTQFAPLNHFPVIPVKLTWL